MKVDNPLSQKFLVQYPVEAARVLEEVSAQHVAALFNELSPQTGIPVLAAMLPEKAAACLGLMGAVSAARVLTDLPLSTAARIYRLLASTKQDELLALLSGKIRSHLHQFMLYPAESAGALLDPKVDILPDNITVAEALRRIERLSHPVSCEIYIVDDSHHLVGTIDLGKLLVSNHHAKLKDTMIRKIQTVSVHATVESLLSHPGWAKRRKLPVVARDNTLLGVLDYSCMQEAINEAGMVVARDPLDNLLSVASLYWLSMAQLLDSLLSISHPVKGEHK
ncbi:MAG: hypothetical protein OQK73_03195 [Gammaproteobacteria bacterium]|nr:hypothetical protein [Gammaproteobacteria bacterium]